MITVPTTASIVVSYKQPGLLEGCHLLVADDSAAIRFVAAAMLRRQGAIVTEASDGQQASSFTTAGNFDLLLLDVQMPDMDGLQVTQKLREKGFCHIPILALTGSDVTEHMACLNAGMDDIVRKPFTHASLISKVLAGLEKFGRKVNNYTTFHDWERGSLFSAESLHKLCDGDSALVKRMLNVVLRELPLAAIQMRVACRQGDIEQLARVAHRVRPCLQSLGILTLSEKMTRIETMTSLDYQDNYADLLIADVASEMEVVARQIIADM